MYHPELKRRLGEVFRFNDATVNTLNGIFFFVFKKTDLIVQLSLPVCKRVIDACSWLLRDKFGFLSLFSKLKKSSLQLTIIIDGFTMNANVDAIGNIVL